MKALVKSRDTDKIIFFAGMFGRGSGVIILTLVLHVLPESDDSVTGWCAHPPETLHCATRVWIGLLVLS
jgi:hypothetical protein